MALPPEVPTSPWKRRFDAARDPQAARNALGLLSTGGGSGAPTTAEYITASPDATLTAERVLTDTATVTWDFTTAGQAKANAASSGVPTTRTITAGAGLFGGGDLSADRIIDVGSGEGIQTGANNVNLDFNGLVEMTLPPDPGDFLCAYHLVATAHRKIKVSTLGFQPLDATLTALAAYNTNGLLTQTAADTFTGRTLTGPAAGIAVTNGNGVAGNPTLALANDLAALEGLSGTNTIYYRSAADTWSAVTIGGNMTFSGGTLNSVAGGSGNVSNSGTPTAGQFAQWVDATHIQGVAPFKAATTQVFTTGSGTYTTPAGVIWLEVEIVGGGGGGSANTVGGVGGNTTFGSLTANGGNGGTTGIGGRGGTASGGVMNLTGGGGGPGSASTSASTQGTGGHGGASAFGGGGASSYGAPGSAGEANTGGGGGGGAQSAAGTAVSGGGGGSGGYCRGVIASPAATYSYAVGGGGSAGTGTSPLTGGAGGSGIIIVVEHYG